jgi:predicted nucleic acid-binding Zn ribbon protein
MLSEEENAFIDYWEQNRNKKKRLIWQLAGGLPLAVLIAAGIFVNFFSGWYTRAAMQIRSNSSEILVILIALILIVVFVVIFSGKHKWDMNEQRYKELKQKKNIS